MKWNANDMPLFVAVIDCEGITAAANKLNMPKSTLSRSIARLEADLGLRLIERNSRKFRLTAEGKSFYGHCLQVKEQLEAASATVSGFKKEPSGKLTVSMPIGFSYEVIAPVLADFIMEYPKIKLDLKVAGMDLDLYRSDIDLAVQVGPLPDSELIATKLFDSPQIWVGAPAYIKQHALNTNDIGIATLGAHMQLIVSSLYEGNFLLEYQNKTRAMFKPLHAVINDSGTVRKAVINGAGIALLPQILVQRAIDAGELQEIAKECRITPEVVLYAVYPSKKFVSEKTQLFISFMRKAIEAKFKSNKS